MTPAQNRWAVWLRENEPARYNLATKQGWDAFVHAAPRAPLKRLSRAELDRLGVEEREDYDDARAVWNANPTTVHTVMTLAEIPQLCSPKFPSLGRSVA